MAGSEKLFENKIKKFLKDQGAWFIKYWGGGPFTKEGIPDLIACVNGKFIAIEVKAPNGKPSALQKWNIDQINKAGGIGLILYPKDFEEFKKIILEVKNGRTGQTN